MDMTELAWLYGQPCSKGVSKSYPEDFLVIEELGFPLSGEGEFVLVNISKKGCNTQFVAEYLAKFAGIPPYSVSYAGLKDRYAVTEQWFCLHLPGKPSPDFTQFQLEGCVVLQTTRHSRKLRIGALKGNDFTLVLRNISHLDETEQRLNRIKKGGVPNYFGEQRFGQQGNNLLMAQRWAKGEINVRDRNKRSFYLSAARSALFNLVSSQRIVNQQARKVLAGDALQLTGRGSWFIAQKDQLPDLQRRLDLGELVVTAPLPGDAELGTEEEVWAFEQQCLLGHQSVLALLKRERVAPARRALLLQPQQMQWHWKDDTTLELKFGLPAGCFATSVLREIIQQQENKTWQR